MTPAWLQKRMQKELHVGHPGISWMKSLMRCYLYWLKMDEDIEDVVKSCRGCSLAAKSPPIKFQPWPKPDVPWSTKYTDFARPLNGAYYHVVVNSYTTNWPEISKYRRLTNI